MDDFPNAASSGGKLLFIRTTKALNTGQLPPMFAVIKGPNCTSLCTG